jgi:hypothetical protein
VHKLNETKSWKSCTFWICFRANHSI